MQRTVFEDIGDGVDFTYGKIGHLFPVNYQIGGKKAPFCKKLRFC